MFYCSSFRQIEKYVYLRYINTNVSKAKEKNMPKFFQM